jgi:hypothetical protein
MWVVCRDASLAKYDVTLCIGLLRGRTRIRCTQRVLRNQVIKIIDCWRVNIGKSSPRRVVKTFEVQVETEQVLAGNPEQ